MDWWIRGWRRRLRIRLRAHVLAILNERVSSPNQMAEELGEPLGNVSYHVKALLELQCIELVSTTPRRGAVEHFYRAIERPYFSERDWNRLPRSLRRAISDVGLQLIWDDVADAIDGGTFEARTDRHLSRYPLVLDERGWEELGELLTGLFEQTVRDRVRERRAPGGERGGRRQLEARGPPLRVARRRGRQRRRRPPARRRAPPR